VYKTVAELQGKQELKLNVLQALCLAAAEWSSVNSDFVAHCFNRSGFGVTTFNKNVDDGQTDEDKKKVPGHEVVTFTDL
jgi:hypothetical protein